MGGQPPICAQQELQAIAAVGWMFDQRGTQPVAGSTARSALPTPMPSSSAFSPAGRDCSRHAAMSPPARWTHLRLCADLPEPLPSRKAPGELSQIFSSRHYAALMTALISLRNGMEWMEGMEWRWTWKEFGMERISSTSN